jgi:hypothetical protein
VNKLKNFFQNKYYLFIILIPFLEFYNHNIFEFSKEISLFYFIYTILFTSFVLILFYSTSYFSKINFTDLKFYIVIIFFLLFRHDYFEKNLFIFTGKLSGEISLLFIFLLLIIVFFVNKFFNIQNLLKNFFLIYFFLLFFQFLTGLELRSSNYKDDLNTNNNLFKNEFIGKNFNSKKNIYYIVTDAMTSLEKYQSYYPGLSENTVKDFKKFIYEKDLIYYENNSAYNSTRISFHSMLNLKYEFNENSTSKELLDYSNLYPETMKTNSLEQYQLIKILKFLNYKIKWEGSPFPGTCTQYNLDLCIKKEKNFLKNFFYRFRLNNHILKVFISNTPIDEIYYRTGLKNFFKKNIYSEFIGNDAIENFMNKTRYEFNFDDGPYFFLIHHMSPHSPYVYNSDCSQREISKIDEEEIFPVGYHLAYQCVLKKIKKFIKFIEEKDIDSVIVIQGDHGGDFGNNSKEKALNASTAFNLFRLDKKTKCFDDDLEFKADMINNARLVLTCALQIKPDLLKKESYIRFYREGTLKKL